MTVNHDIDRLDRILLRAECVYDRYARSCGLSGTAHHLLYILHSYGPCTQRHLCEQLLTPKQTIHSIVKAFQADGILETATDPADKRQKLLQLTEEGRRLVNDVMPRVLEAERCAMAQFTEEERRLFFSLAERYVRTLEEKML